MSSLGSLNLSKMIISPLDSEVKKKFYQITGEAKVEVDASCLAKYILLMYDPNSPLIELVDDYWSRKYEALELSGFKSKNGKFDAKVEDFVLGKNENVSDLIISWLIYVSKPKWSHYIYLNESLLRYTRQTQSFEEKDKMKPGDIEAVSKIMRELTIVGRDFMGGDETKEFLERLYYKTYQELLKIRPEHYASRLTGGETLDEDCPYGNYKVEKLKFAGAKILSEKVVVETGKRKYTKRG